MIQSSDDDVIFLFFLSPRKLCYQVPYEADVPEDTEIGTTIFDKVLIRDKDTVGENLDIVCTPHEQNPDACFKYVINDI